MKLIPRILLHSVLGISVLPLAHAGTTLTQAWAILPTDGLSYIGTGNRERGIAFNPMTGNLLLVSAAVTPPRIVVLDATTGALKHEMDTTGVAEGNSGIILNMIGVADDGAVYACNLVVASAAAPLPENAKLKIYRWDSEAPGVPPARIFNDDPSGLNASDGSNTPNRWGDSFAVRGSGLNTQILIGSGVTGTVSTGVDACVFTSPDGINVVPHFLAGALEPGGSKGISFGAGDTFYSKASGGSKKIRRSSFDPVDSTAAMLNDFTVPPSAGIQIIPIALDLNAHLWGTFETGSAGPENARLFDITSVNTTPTQHDIKTLPTDNTNTNAVGSAAIGGERLFVCDTNNGVVAYNIVVTPDLVPPSVTTSPAARSAYERGQTTFSVIATGTPPLAYQWFLEDAPIDGATSPDYTINPVTAAHGGSYKCRVTNAGPTPAFSTPALLTVLPSANTGALTEVWRLQPGSRPYITNGNTERGMDYHPATNRIYLASRTPKVLKVLSGTNGDEIGSMLTTDLNSSSGGLGGFELNMVGVGADGAIYACNLSNTTAGATLGSGFKIYQWPDDGAATPPAVLFDGQPAQARIGDTIDVRGSGLATQVVCGTNAAGQFVIFTKDGNGFLVPKLITIGGDPVAAFSAGIAFGNGNSVWGKTLGGALYLGCYDLPAGTGAVVATYGAAIIPGTVNAIGVDMTSGFLAGLEVHNSDNTRLYSLPVPFPDPPPATLELLDQEFFVTNNDNGNHAGSVAVNGDKVFALDTHNGLVAYTAVKPAAGTPPVITDVTQSAGSVVFKLKGTVGKTYLIEKSTELFPAASWSPDGTVTQNAAEETVTRAIPNGTPRLYFRAREQ